MAIELEGVRKAFGDAEAVAGVDLVCRPGELVAVLGPSGCGKTTLLRAIAGFERPDSGRITVGDEVVSSESVWVAPERRRIGMVFQDYALFPHMRVRDNVGFGLTRRSDDERRELTRRTLELVGLDHRADAYPHELSGGERQRVALARALAPGPDLVLLDEPFSNLDAALRAGLRREVELILREADATALLVTHDQEEALSLADRLAVMRDGRLVQFAAPEEVYARPAQRWIAEFVGEVNVLDADAHGSQARTPLGDITLAQSGEGPVQVALRPEQLEVVDGDDANARVVHREFRGHDVVYRVEHEQGASLLIQLSSLTLYEIGQRVRVRPAARARTMIVD